MVKKSIKNNYSADLMKSIHTHVLLTEKDYIQLNIFHMSILHMIHYEEYRLLQR